MTFKVDRPKNVNQELESMMTKKDVVKMNFEINRDLRQKFKVHAANNNTTMGEVLTNFIKTLVD